MSLTNESSFFQSSLIPFAWRISTVIVGLVSIAAGFLYFKQDSLLYFPQVPGLPKSPHENPSRYQSPSEHDLPYQDLFITCSDGVQIHAWLVSRKEGTKSKNGPIVVFFHGNAGNIGFRLPNVVQLLHHVPSVQHVLMVEYRGYGNSNGIPSESGLKLDALASIDYCHRNYPDSPIFVMGRSLGGAVAFSLLQQNDNKNNNNKIAGLIVENTFTSISDMVDHIMPSWVALLKPLVLRIGWNSLDIVKTQLQQSPLNILYLAGRSDTLVPHTHMQKLFQTSRRALATSGAICKMHVVPNGTHNETWLQGGRAYWKAIQDFIHNVITNMQQQQDSTLSTATTTTTSEMTPGASSTATAIPTMPQDLVGMARGAYYNQQQGNNGQSTTPSSTKKTE